MFRGFFVWFVVVGFVGFFFVFVSVGLFCFVLNYIHVTFFSGWLWVSLEFGVIFKHVSGGGPALLTALPLVGACIARGSQPHQHLLLIKVSHCHLQPLPSDFTSDSQKDSPLRTRSGGAEALVH